MMALMGSVTAVYTDLPEQIMTMFDDTVMAAQAVCTAGDLHSMSVMLDAAYIMDRRLPAENEFAAWLEVTFKENNMKDLWEDHWGTRYVYTIDSKRRRYQLRSAGPDTIFNNDDDMVKTGP